MRAAQCPPPARGRLAARSIGEEIALTHLLVGPTTKPSASGAGGPRGPRPGAYGDRAEDTSCCNPTRLAVPGAVRVVHAWQYRRAGPDRRLRNLGAVGGRQVAGGRRQIGTSRRHTRKLSY